MFIKEVKSILMGIFLVSVSGSVVIGQHPLTSAITYQGHLDQLGSPANGRYDFMFSLFDDKINGSMVAGPIVHDYVLVQSGRFTLLLDFDPWAFNGQARWVEIAVRPGYQTDPCEFTILSPRQELTPAPYSLYAMHTRAVWGGTVNKLAKFIDPEILGDSEIVEDSGNVGIGTDNPGEKLHIVGSLKIVDGTQGLDKVLVSDDNGRASWLDLSSRYYTKSEIDSLFYTKADLDDRLLTPFQKAELTDGGVTSLHYHSSAPLEAWPTFHTGSTMSETKTGTTSSCHTSQIGECVFSKAPGTTLFRVSSTCQISDYSNCNGIKIETTCGTVDHHPSMTNYDVYYDDLFDCSQLADYSQISVKIFLTVDDVGETTMGSSDVYVQQNAP